MSNDSPSPKSLYRLSGWLVLMGLLTALGPLAVDMYLPAFPAIATELGVPTALVERTLAGYLLGLALAQLVYGPLADRYGRKLPMLLGLVIFIVASVGASLVASIEQMSWWRVAQAFGGAAGMVIPRAVIRDHFDTQDSARALSLLMMIMGATPILAPLLGAQVLHVWSWRGIFLVMAACGAILLVAVQRVMRESLAPERATALAPGIILRNYGQLLRDRRFMGYTLAGGFGTAGMFTYIAGSPRVFIDIFQVDPARFGLLFGINAAALIVASQVSARLLNRHAAGLLLRYAQRLQVAFALAGLALTLAGMASLPLLMLCLAGFMASQGFVSPNAAAMSLDGQGRRLGVASALMGSIQMLCGAIAGWSVSAWHTPSPLPLTSILAACAVLSLLCGRMARRA